MKEKNRNIWQGIKSVMLVITVVFVFVAVTSSIAMDPEKTVYGVASGTVDRFLNIWMKASRASCNN